MALTHGGHSNRKPDMELNDGLSEPSSNHEARHQDDLTFFVFFTSNPIPKAAGSPRILGAVL